MGERFDDAIIARGKESGASPSLGSGVMPEEGSVPVEIPADTPAVPQSDAGGAPEAPPPMSAADGVSKAALETEVPPHDAAPEPISATIDAAPLAPIAYDPERVEPVDEAPTTEKPEGNVRSLANARARYVRMLRESGRLLRRGGIAKEAAEAAAEYQNLIHAARSSELELKLEEIRSSVLTRRERGEISTAEEAENAVKEQFVAAASQLMREEEQALDAAAKKELSAGVFEKAKKFWHDHAGTRLVIGGAMAGLAYSGVGTAVAGAAFFSFRGVWGMAGMFMGAEAAMERYSKGWGHRGLIDAIYKKTGKGKADPIALREHVAGYSDKEVLAELDRLRALRIEKGVALANAGRDGEKTSSVVTALLEREATFVKKNVRTKLEHAEASPETVMVDSISEYLQHETRERERFTQEAVGRERAHKKMRKLTAALVAVTTGAIMGNAAFKAFMSSSDAAPIPPQIVQGAGVEPGPGPIPPAGSGLDLSDFEAGKAATNADWRLNLPQTPPAQYNELIQKFGGPLDASHTNVDWRLNLPSEMPEEFSLADAKLGVAVSAAEHAPAAAESVASTAVEGAGKLVVKINQDEGMIGALGRTLQDQYRLPHERAMELANKIWASNTPEEWNNLVHAGDQFSVDLSGVPASDLAADGPLGEVARAADYDPASFEATSGIPPAHELPHSGAMPVAESPVAGDASHTFLESLKPYEHIHASDEAARFITQHGIHFDPETLVFKTEFSSAETPSGQIHTLILGEYEKTANIWRLEITTNADGNLSLRAFHSDNKALYDALELRPDLSVVRAGEAVLETSQAARTAFEMAMDGKEIPGRLAGKLLHSMSDIWKAVGLVEGRQIEIVEKVRELNVTALGTDVGDITKTLQEHLGITKGEAKHIAKPLVTIVKGLSKKLGVQFGSEDTVGNVLRVLSEFQPKE